MSQQTAATDATDYESIHEAVNDLEEGDTFQIYANTYRVAEKVECDVRPYFTVEKESVSGFMSAHTRVEQADPTTPEADDEIVVKIDRKHGWDVRFTCDVSEIAA